MCGIFGIFGRNNSVFNSTFVRSSLTTLARLSESRGKDSSGLVFRNEVQREFSVIKGSLRLTTLLKSKEATSQISRELNHNESFAVMGHSRLVTNGSQLSDVNNQPVVKDGIIGIHNGIIVNEKELWQKYQDIQRSFEIDTEVMLSLIRRNLRSGNNLENSVSKTIEEVFGTVAAAFFVDDLNELVLATNNGSLYILSSKSGFFAFASEEYFLKELAADIGKYLGNNYAIQQIIPHTGYILDLENFALRKFSFSGNSKSENRSPILHAPFPISIEAVSDGKPQRELVLDPATLAAHPRAQTESKLLECNIDSIKKLKRCKKCILPETYPFIEFDEKGVCNYCNNYRPKCNTKPIEELFTLVEPYRRTDGKYDCIIPFSGGRDSTYTLHIAKKILKLHPVAFTYDWGMVNDLARRNIARVCGKLGVENIIVAARLAWKRENIRKNILAWLKKPNLGMIPLFMAGDKYFYYYADQIKRQTGVRLNIWGINPLENTDFKVGFLGVPPDHKKKRIYSLSAKKMNTLFMNIVKNVAANPLYINRSVWNTIGSFISRSVVPHRDYYHMFDYYRWDEKEIEQLVLEEYHWERAIDTKTTWRIGDGTAAFYNYIYYTVAGFSEYDTFRSNQIREGMISRERALELVDEENRPRYPSIKWYTDILSLDFSTTIGVINKIPKLYIQ